MSKHKIIILFLAFFALNCFFARAQNFVRIGGAFDFNKEQLLQTFSFDLNRTEKVDEKIGKFLLFNKKGFYLLPAIDINLGEKTTSSEDNITAQLNAGKQIFGLPAINGKKTYIFNQAYELNPTYSADKTFNENLYYLQGKYILNNLWSVRSNGAGATAYAKRFFSMAYGPFVNFGGRSSQLYDRNKVYFTAGVFTEAKMRISGKENETDLNEEAFANWLIKLSGNVYHIASDIAELNKDGIAGTVKFSVDKRIRDIIYIGLLYKYGNDNPTYKRIHTIELGFKFNYLPPKK
jgi:hypothetical protein